MHFHFPMSMPEVPSIVILIYLLNRLSNETKLFQWNKILFKQLITLLDKKFQSLYPNNHHHHHQRNSQLDSTIR
jgi:hypothetical protein